MASIREISYDLIQHVRANSIDDDDLDYRSVKFWVNNQRALWLKNKLSENKETPEVAIQELTGEAVTGTSTLKHTSSLLTPLIVKGEAQILSVGSDDEDEFHYKFGTYKHSKHYNNGRFNEDFIFAYFRDGEVYIKGADLSDISTVDIRGVFVNPLDADGMTDDSEYPFPEDMIPYLKAEIMKIDLSTFIRLPNDKSNDGQNNLN